MLVTFIDVHRPAEHQHRCNHVPRGSATVAPSTPLAPSARPRSRAPRAEDPGPALILVHIASTFIRHLSQSTRDGPGLSCACRANTFLSSGAGHGETNQKRTAGRASHGAPIRTGVPLIRLRNPTRCPKDPRHVMFRDFLARRAPYKAYKHDLNDAIPTTSMLMVGLTFFHRGSSTKRSTTVELLGRCAHEAMRVALILSTK